MAKGQRGIGEDKSELVAQMPAACADERLAVEFFERQRWNGNVACPHCGVVDSSYQMKDRATGERSARWLWRCRECGKQFTAKTGTVMEDSPIPYRFWLTAFWLCCSSKKGVSALQVKRATGVTYRSALFMLHRIRFAVGVDPTPAPKFTGIVQADETHVGGKPRTKGKGKRIEWTSKQPVLAVVEKAPGGKVRAQHVSRVNAPEIEQFLRKHVDIDNATLHTDESTSYIRIGRQFGGGHESVNHKAKEYARGSVTSNTAECFFALCKRSVYGIHHSVSPKHLGNYLNEWVYRFDTRGVDDGERTVTAIRQAAGKRLTYKQHVKRG